ncbi:protein of unknown function (plasmid) [Cupriavidus neocaledonicus]|uniref:Uncharacterized protein n=1 Tax=Cupriavidus neocaledonicus TaxID=1040979 RepID=A0A375HUP0_9BURK|nr:hypothetical protein CBM2605_B70060 [Cupriavidus neocaledonicus]SPD60594.1 protein of unknown function [Cupriavidus neocaledonicus]
MCLRRRRVTMGLSPGTSPAGMCEERARPGCLGQTMKAGRKPRPLRRPYNRGTKKGHRARTSQRPGSPGALRTPQWRQRKC